MMGILREERVPMTQSDGFHGDRVTLSQHEGSDVFL